MTKPVIHYSTAWEVSRRRLNYQTVAYRHLELGNKQRLKEAHGCGVNHLRIFDLTCYFYQASCNSISSPEWKHNRNQTIPAGWGISSHLCYPLWNLWLPRSLLITKQCTLSTQLPSKLQKSDRSSSCIHLRTQLDSSWWHRLAIHFEDSGYASCWWSKLHIRCDKKRLTSIVFDRTCSPLAI